MSGARHCQGSMPQAAGQSCCRNCLVSCNPHCICFCSLSHLWKLCSERMHAATHQPHLCPALLTPAEPLQAPWSAAPARRAHACCNAPLPSSDAGSAPPDPCPPLLLQAPWSAAWDHSCWVLWRGCHSCGPPSRSCMERCRPRCSTSQPHSCTQVRRRWAGIG